MIIAKPVLIGMLRTEFEGSTSKNGIRTIGLSGLSGLLDYQDYQDYWTIRTIGLLDYQDYWTIRTIGLSGLSGLLDYQDYWTIRTIRTIGLSGLSGLLCENKLLCNYAQFWWIAMLVFKCVQELAPIEIGQKKIIVHSHNSLHEKLSWPLVQSD